jgi:hypothetical protein
MGNRAAMLCSAFAGTYDRGDAGADLAQEGRSRSPTRKEESRHCNPYGYVTGPLISTQKG